MGRGGNSKGIKTYYPWNTQSSGYLPVTVRITYAGEEHELFSTRNHSAYKLQNRGRVLEHQSESLDKLSDEEELLEFILTDRETMEQLLRPESTSFKKHLFQDAREVGKLSLKVYRSLSAHCPKRGYL